MRGAILVLLAGVIVMGILATPSAGGSSATVVSIGDYEVSKGSSILIPIMVWNVTDVIGGEINISFDPSIVHVSSTSYNGDIGVVTTNINNSTGFAYMNTFGVTGKSGDIVFAWLNFTAVGCIGGKSPLNITVIALFNSTYADIPHFVNNGSFTSAGGYVEFAPEEYYALSGEVINTQLTLNATEPMGAIHFRIDYNPSVCNITSVTQQNGFDVLVANTEHASEGWIEFICYQTGAAGAGNITFIFSTQAVGDYGTKTYLNTTVITLKTNSGSPMVYEVTNASFRIALKGDFSGDMDVDVWDCAYLCRYLIGLAGYEELCSGDISGDGVLDSYDCTYLARKLIGLEY